MPKDQEQRLSKNRNSQALILKIYNERINTYMKIKFISGIRNQSSHKSNINTRKYVINIKDQFGFFIYNYHIIKYL